MDLKNNPNRPEKESFSWQLSSNDKVVRQRAVKKLRLFLSKKVKFMDKELKKIMKGLFYCMWLCDMPLIQEELAESLAKIIHVFQDTETSFDWLEAFFFTLNKHWEGIDYLRIDKFMMLVRKIVHQSFVMLKNHGWKIELVESLCGVFECIPLSQSISKEGFVMHFTDIFLTELKSVLGSQKDQNLSPENQEEIIFHFLEPFFQLLATSKHPRVLKRIQEAVFEPLIWDTAKFLDSVAENPENPPVEEASALMIQDWDFFSSRFQEMAQDPSAKDRNKKILFQLKVKSQKLHKYFIAFKESSKEISNGSLAQKPIEAESLGINQTPTMASIKQGFESEPKNGETKKSALNKKKKKKGKKTVEPLTQQNSLEIQKESPSTIPNLRSVHDSIPELPYLDATEASPSPVVTGHIDHIALSSPTKQLLEESSIKAHTESLPVSDSTHPTQQMNGGSLPSKQNEQDSSEKITLSSKSKISRTRKQSLSSSSPSPSEIPYYPDTGNSPAKICNKVLIFYYSNLLCIHLICIH
eukprot:Sdes_comp20869_c0_seq1m17778